MPPRWPRQPTRLDPEFRKLDDRYTLAFHIAVYLSTTTGLIFFKLLWHSDWIWFVPLLGWWGLALGLHTLWILKIIQYSPSVHTELEPSAYPLSTDPENTFQTEDQKE